MKHRDKDKKKNISAGINDSTAAFSTAAQGAKKALMSRASALVIAFIMLLGAGASWFVLNLAWFTKNSTVNSDGMNMSVVEQNPVQGTFYHKVDGIWVPVTEILIENYIPGHFEEYQFRLSNASTTNSYDITVKLTEFVTTGMSAGINGDYKLADKIILSTYNTLTSEYNAGVSLSVLGDNKIEGLLTVNSVVEIGTLEVPANVEQGSTDYVITFKLTLAEDTNTDETDAGGSNSSYDYMSAGLRAEEIVIAGVEIQSEETTAG